MSTNIIEFNGQERTDGLSVVPHSRVIQTVITASASSQQSAAFDAGTNLIVVQSDEAVRIARGTNPTALAPQGYKIYAGTEQWFTVLPGEKIAVILAT